MKIIILVGSCFLVLVLIVVCLVIIIIQNKIATQKSNDFMALPQIWEDLNGSPFLFNDTGLENGKIKKDHRTGYKYSAPSLEKNFTSEETKAFCDHLNLLGFANITNWDLPTSTELLNISGVNSMKPVDNSFLGENYYWTASKENGNPVYVYLPRPYKESTKLPGAAVRCISKE